MKKTKKNIFRIIFATLTVLCALVAIYSIGKNINSPFDLSLKLNSPSALAIDDSGRVRGVIDNNGARLISLDENQNVVGVKQKSTDESGLSFFSALDYLNGNLYTTEVYYSENKYSIEKETVTCYSPNLLSNKVVREIDNDDKIEKQKRFKRFERYDNHLYIVESNFEKSTLMLVDLCHGSAVKNIDVSCITSGIQYCDYNKQCDTLALISDDGSLYMGNIEGNITRVAGPEKVGIVKALIVGDDGKVYLSKAADNGICTCYNNDVHRCIDGIEPYYLEFEHDLYICDLTDSSVKVYSAELLNSACLDYEHLADNNPIIQPSKSFNEVYFSSFLYFVNLLFWISYLWLLICIVVFACKKIYEIIHKNEIQKLSVITTGVLIIVGVVLIFAFFNDAIYQQNLNFLKAQAETTSASLSSSIEKNYTLVESNNSEVVLDNFISSTSKDLEEQDSKMDYIEFGSDCFVILKYQDKYYYINSVTALSSSNNKKLENLYSYFENGNTSEISMADFGIKQNDGLITGYSAIYNSNHQIVGYVGCSSWTDNALLKQESFMKNFLIALLAIGGVLTLIILEANSFFKMLQRRKRDIGTDKFPEIWSARGTMFFACMASGFDCTISVLIAKDMLLTNGIDNPVLFGFPAMFSCVGLTLGTLSSTYLAQRIPGKKLALYCLTPAALLNGLTVWAVAENYFWIFCALKLITDWAVASYSKSIYLLPLRTSNEKRRAKVSKEINISQLSANALGGIIAGFVATYLGNCYVYLFAIAPVVLCIVYSVKMLPSHTIFKVDAEKGKKESILPALKMMISPQMIGLYIFGYGASLLAYNFKSILFPLFASDAGLTKVEINNIIVLANVLIFALAPVISKWFKKFDYWLIMFICVVMQGVVLLLCGINSSLIWAFVILLITGYAHRTIMSCAMILWPREALKRGVNKAKGSLCVQTLVAILDTAKTPILGAFVGLGQVVVCCGLGVWSIISALGYTTFTGKSALRQKQSKSKQTNEDNSK